MTELQKRVLSAVVLIPLVLYVILAGGWLFNIVLIWICLLMLYEWFTITKGFWWKVFGVVYIGGACLAVDAMRLGYSDVMEGLVLLIILCTISLTDTGAYFIGKKFGKKKLAPKISPNKTWAGFFGGILCSLGGIFLAVAIMLLLVFLTDREWFADALEEMKKIFSDVYFYLDLEFILFPIIISVLAQIGDLFESWVKRKFDVKDSGNIIPGHGGILDRLDGLIFVYFLIFIFVKIHTLYLFNWSLIQEPSDIIDLIVYMLGF